LKPPFKGENIDTERVRLPEVKKEGNDVLGNTREALLRSMPPPDSMAKRDPAARAGKVMDTAP